MVLEDQMDCHKGCEHPRLNLDETESRYEKEVNMLTQKPTDREHGRAYGSFDHYLETKKTIVWLVKLKYESLE